MSRLMKSLALVTILLGVAASTAWSAGKEDERPLNDLVAAFSDKTWYGLAVGAGGYRWQEYFTPDGQAYYADNEGRLDGTWEVTGEDRVCFSYPTLGSYCFRALRLPNGQYGIYDVDQNNLIHITTQILEGDPEGLSVVPQIGDEVGS